MRRDSESATRESRAGVSQAYQTTHDATGATSLSVTVVEAVAAAKGVPPAGIEQPLYDVVDPDALDRLFDPAGQSADAPRGRVVVTLAGCEVTVGSDGDVTVRHLD